MSSALCCIFFTSVKLLRCRAGDFGVVRNTGVMQQGVKHFKLFFFKCELTRMNTPYDLRPKGNEAKRVNLLYVSQFHDNCTPKCEMNYFFVLIIIICSFSFHIQGVGHRSGVYFL